MEEISNEEWGRAVNHTKEMLDVAKGLGWTGMFYVSGCIDLLKRYDNGERTTELYQDMISLH